LDPVHVLDVHKIFVEPHVPVNRLHHPQAQAVVSVLKSDGGDLVFDRPGHGHQPRHNELVPLQQVDRVFAARAHFEPPLFPAAQDHLPAPIATFLF
jgi:hypothetical protein